MKSLVQKLLSRQFLIVALLGLSSGLPFSLVTETLKARMRSEGIDLATIGIIGSLTLPYTLKFLWAPLVDRFSLTVLGRRRSWMLLGQLLLIVGIIAMGLADPKTHLFWQGVFAFFVSFASATQDIAIDAWRRESLSEDELGFGSSLHVSSYLFSARILSGGLALVLSDYISWSQVYYCMVVVVIGGVFASLWAAEPQLEFQPPRTLKEAAIDPLLDYFKRPGAILILFFILFYKIGDNMAAQMTMPLYLDVGFTRTEVGAITKLVGWIALAAGGLIGGAIMFRLSFRKALFVFGIFQAISNLGFIGLLFGKSNLVLAGVLGFENFASGMGTAAFSAFMASLTNKRFTGTQYALLTSFMGIPRVLVSIPSGFLAQSLGYQSFFVLTAFMAIPGLVLIRFLPTEKKSVST